jgi:hypothetical protein
VSRRIFVIWTDTDNGGLYQEELTSEDDARAFMASEEHENDRALLFKITNECNAYQTEVEIEDHT